MRFIVKASLFVCFALTAFAQGDRGTITGTVSDPAGAVVPAAAVSARNTETGVTNDTETTATGNYTLNSLPPGLYDVTVSAAGFSKSVQAGLRVNVAMTIRVDVVLKLGASTESITVTGGAEMLRTESAEQSQTISGLTINSLPINFSVIAGGYLRSPFAFMNLTPGALQSGQNTMIVNGITNNVTMRVDGQDSTNVNSNSRIDELQPSVEAVQEFTLQSSNFSAEYGQVGAGIFNFAIRSGTNEYHGSAYENYSNADFNAGQAWSNDGQNHKVVPYDTKSDYGFSVGGPVRIPHVYNGKNRTFFFANVELYYSKATAGGTFTTVPTAAMRNGDFSAVLTGRQLLSGGAGAVDPLGNKIMENAIYDPASTATVNGLVTRTMFPNNTIPLTRMDPTAVAIQKLIPAPQNNLLINNWQQVYPNNKTMDDPGFKIDHSINDKMKVSFYFSRFATNQYVNPDGLPIPLTHLRILYERNDTYRTNFDYIITPSLALHAGIGFIRYRNPDVMLDGVKNFDSPGQLGLKGSDLPGGLGFPSFTTMLGNQGGMALNLGPSNGSLYFEDKPTAIASLSWVRGNHTYKTGLDWRRDDWTNRQYNQAIGAYGFSANQTMQPSTTVNTVTNGSTGYIYASFLLGMVNTATMAPPYDPQYRRPSYSLFIQDTWKVTRKLTLDYGIRWDLTLPTREIHDRWSEFAPTVANPSAGGLLGATIYEGNGAGRCNCRFVNVYPFALGPRLGVAYQLTPKTVMRGGWGLTYTPLASFGYLGGGSSIGTAWNTLTYNPNNLWESAYPLSQGFQYTQSQLLGASLDPGIRPQAGQVNNPPNLIDPNAGRPGRIMQWNISLQREVFPNLLVEAAYVGSRAAWLNYSTLTAYNNLTPAMLTKDGLDINSAADRALLRSTITSAAVVARGFKLPYAGFPTGQTLDQALRPFPQFGALGPSYAPLGNLWYDALQAKITKRTSHGLTLTSSFTFQGQEDTMQGVNDVFNRPNQKNVSNTSQPFMFVTAYSYELPKIGSNKLVRNVVGGWTFGGVLRYASGTPIAVPGSNNNLGSLLQQGTRMNRVPGQPLLLVSNLNCSCFDPGATFALNPKAWSDPSDGQWGYGPAFYKDYRNRRAPDEEMSLGRMFRFRERFTLSVRVEFFNVFNRLVYPALSGNNPATTATVGSNGLTTGGFGYYNVAAAANVQTGGIIPTSRNGQLVARFQF